MPLFHEGRQDGDYSSLSSISHTSSPPRGWVYSAAACVRQILQGRTTDLATSTTQGHTVRSVLTDRCLLPDPSTAAFLYLPKSDVSVYCVRAIGSCSQLSDAIAGPWDASLLSQPSETCASLCRLTGYVLGRRGKEQDRFLTKTQPRTGSSARPRERPSNSAWQSHFHLPASRSQVVVTPVLRLAQSVAADELLRAIAVCSGTTERLNERLACVSSRIYVLSVEQQPAVGHLPRYTRAWTVIGDCQNQFHVRVRVQSCGQPSVRCQIDAVVRCEQDEKTRRLYWDGAMYMTPGERISSSRYYPSLCPGSRLPHVGFLRSFCSVPCTSAYLDPPDVFTNYLKHKQNNSVQRRLGPYYTSSGGWSFLKSDRSPCGSKSLFLWQAFRLSCTLRLHDDQAGTRIQVFLAEGISQSGTCMQCRVDDGPLLPKLNPTITETFCSSDILPLKDHTLYLTCDQNLPGSNPHEFVLKEFQVFQGDSATIISKSTTPTGPPSSLPPTQPNPQSKNLASSEPSQTSSSTSTTTGLESSSSSSTDSHSTVTSSPESSSGSSANTGTIPMNGSESSLATPSAGSASPSGNHPSPLHSGYNYIPPSSTSIPPNGPSHRMHIGAFVGATIGALLLLLLLVFSFLYRRRLRSPLPFFRRRRSLGIPRSTITGFISAVPYDTRIHVNTTVSVARSQRGSLAVPPSRSPEMTQAGARMSTLTDGTALTAPKLAAWIPELFMVPGPRSSPSPAPTQRPLPSPPPELDADIDLERASHHSYPYLPSSYHPDWTGPEDDTITIASDIHPSASSSRPSSQQPLLTNGAALGVRDSLASSGASIYRTASESGSSEAGTVPSHMSWHAV
ncbi:hypothetical protein C8Q80DRAFT_442067 [Daedaleopsis nitida]|nr:hypothetical protein C8Q80DRAFT_442067 [Daedaleopsis nitida]